MTIKTFTQLVKDAQSQVEEIYPWDLQDALQQEAAPILLDIREADEFQRVHIADSWLVPRGILESSCDDGYAETLPALVAARDQPIVVICRSGNRSVLAALVMQSMGYNQVVSLKTGLKGWNDAEFPLVDGNGQWVDIDAAEAFLTPEINKVAR